MDSYGAEQRFQEHHGCRSFELTICQTKRTTHPLYEPIDLITYVAFLNRRQGLATIASSQVTPRAEMNNIHSRVVPRRLFHDLPENI